MTGLVIDQRITSNLDPGRANEFGDKLKYFDTGGEEKWAVSVISDWWKRILSYRSVKRSAIGDELRFLPGIGVVFQEAESDFKGLNSEYMKEDGKID